MPLFSLFKKQKRSNKDIFDEDRLSVLIRDHDQKTAQSADTPISPNYAVTPIINENNMDDDFPNVSELNINNSNSVISEGCDQDLFTYHYNDSSFQTLLEHGYQQIRVIRNISQGELIEVRSIKNPFERIVIKKINKELNWNKVTKSDEDGTHTTVEKNIIKEALLLHHCTVTNKPPAAYICQYVDFFHDAKYYYLVMEYAGEMNLATWCNKAFEYMNKGKLDLEHYKQMSKHIFWQISALVFWLHNDMDICHLAIKMEQIMVQNCDFIEDENGTVHINDAILIKLCDFSLAEIFKSKCTGNAGKNAMNTFECYKHCFGHHSQHSAPKVFELGTYNAQKADSWALGVLLYRLTFGRLPFAIQHPKFDTGFCAIRYNRLPLYFKAINMLQYTTEPTILLLSDLLRYDENVRLDCAQIIQHVYFKSYWQRYGVRIVKKSVSQREALHNQQQFMKDFPYYLK